MIIDSIRMILTVQLRDVDIHDTTMGKIGLYDTDNSSTAA